MTIASRAQKIGVQCDSPHDWEYLWTYRRILGLSPYERFSARHDILLGERWRGIKVNWNQCCKGYWGDEALTKTKRRHNGARADNVNPLKAMVNESSSSMIASGRGDSETVNRRTGKTPGTHCKSLKPCAKTLHLLPTRDPLTTLSVLRWSSLLTGQVHFDIQS